MSDEDAYFMALIVSVNRLYDVMLMILTELSSEEKAQAIRTLHQQGKLWAPPPFEFDEEES